MATITFKNGATATINMEELKTLLGLEGIATENVFDTIVISKPLDTRKVDKVASGENREPVPYAKFGKRAKGIADNARKHAPSAACVIQYPAKGDKGNGWIWLDNNGQFVEGLSPNWKWSKRRKMHYYDLNPKPAKKSGNK